MGPGGRIWFVRSSRFARWAIALWLLGYEWLPGLHVALHESLAAHDHDHDRDHDHDHDHAPEPDPDHGDHSIAHRGVASLEAVAIVFAPPVFRVEILAPPALPAGPARSTAPRVLRSRGPPLDRC
jgi:hypothetical protein